MKRPLLILLSSVLIGLSRLPLALGWLGFFYLIPLFYYFESGNKNWKELVRDGLIFSAVTHLLFLHWIIGVTASGFAGMILLYSVYYFLTFGAIQIIWKKLPKLKFAGFFLVILTLEYLQNFSEIRFPWHNLGYSLAEYTILLQILDIGGVVLISALLIVINIMLYLALHRKYVYLLGIGLIMTGWLFYGYWCMKTLELQKTDAAITVMQPSIPQDDKWEEENFNELYQRYMTLSEQAALDSAKLLIWPEAAIPAYVLRQTQMLSLVQRVPDNLGIDLFTGFPDVLPAPANYPGGSYYYNAATLFRPYTRYEDPYYKIILVPVAERMPFMDFIPVLWKLQFGQANWEYGPHYRYYNSHGYLFSPQICFEIAFTELNRKMAFRNLGIGYKGSPEKIDFLVNVTNDAWFGRSAGPWIHGVMTKYRAIENRIQIYRSANTGISMVVDPLGRIISRAELFEIKNISAPLYKSSRLPLYYYLYKWPLVICLLAALLFLISLLKGRDKFIRPRGKR